MAGSGAYLVGEPVASHEDWMQLIGWLPEALASVRSSSEFGRDALPPADERGVYVFTQGNDDLYVGRTGITARTRRSGGRPSTSFLARFKQHTLPGSPPASAPFALRLALATAIDRGVEVPSSPGSREWFKAYRHGLKLGEASEHHAFGELFQEHKDLIADDMTMRIVGFHDDALGIRSSVVEMYFAAVLRTPFNDFSPS
jgi:hypothetical protein